MNHTMNHLEQRRFAQPLAFAHAAVEQPARPARPERAVVLDMMTQALIDFAAAGLEPTRADLIARDFTADEIDDLLEIARRHAALYFETTALREGVPAGRAV